MKRTALFETLRVCAGRPLFVEAHQRRLFTSARALSVPLPHPGFAETIGQFLSRRPLQDAAIRVVLSGGRLKVTVRRWKAPSAGDYRTGVVLAIAPDRVDGTDPLRRHKIYTRKTAPLNPGVFDSLLLTPDDFVMEGSRCNIFVVRGGRLITPNRGVLPGIVRSVVLKIARKERIPVFQRSLHLEELQVADEVFVTNSLVGVLPVRRIARSRISFAGAMTDRIRAGYESAIGKHGR